MLSQRIADLTIGQGIELYLFCVAVGFAVAGIVALCVVFARR